VAGCPASNCVPNRSLRSKPLRGIYTVVYPTSTITDMSSEPGRPVEGLFPEPTRRDLLRTSATAAATGMVVPAMVSAQQAQSSAPSSASMETLQGEVALELTVNGKSVALKVEPRTTLLDALRNRANPPLTGAKLVCDRGNCGACTMIVDDKLVYACLQLAVDMRGKRIRTVEGLSSVDGVSNAAQLSPLQQSFCEHDASMCGFCTSGFVMAITHCLEKKPNASLDDIKLACAGNACRCGTQPHIFEAALAMAKGGAK